MSKAPKTKAEKMVDDAAADQDGKDKAAIDDLAKLGKVAYRRERKAAAERLGIDLKDLNELVREAQRPKKKEAADNDEPPPKTDAELEASARDIIACEDVLAMFEREVGKAISGEERNAKIVYLNATTRVFDKCNHTAIKGPSGCGKSELRTRVLEFMPPESVISFTALSEKALIFEKRSFEHKILSMGEAAATEDAEFQDYLLRELMSEGNLRYPCVQKVDGELITITVEKDGPVSFVVTTTKNTLHQENETRLLSIEVDDSATQTAKVLTKVAQVHGLNGGRSLIELTPWQDFQRWLERGNKRVVIPYAVPLAALIPPSAVRLRRDFTQLLLAIKAHALIHRNHRRVSRAGEIIADVESDYATVRDIMKGVMAESSGKAVKPSVVETVKAVEQAMKEASLLGDNGVTSQQVARVLNLDNSAAYRRLKSAVSDGYVTNLETRPRQPGKYKPSGEPIESSETLPTVEKLLSVSIPSEIAAIVQSPPLSHCFSNDERIATEPAIGDAITVQSGADCRPADGIADGIACDDTIDKGLKINEVTPPIARLRGNRRGEREHNGAGAGSGGGRWTPSRIAEAMNGPVAPGYACWFCGGSSSGSGGAALKAEGIPALGKTAVHHLNCRLDFEHAVALFGGAVDADPKPGDAFAYGPGNRVTRIK